jgi:hypothetical protein
MLLLMMIVKGKEASMQSDYVSPVEFFRKWLLPYYDRDLDEAGLELEDMYWLWSKS